MHMQHFDHASSFQAQEYKAYDQDLYLILFTLEH